MTELVRTLSNFNDVVDEGWDNIEKARKIYLSGISFKDLKENKQTCGFLSANWNIMFPSDTDTSTSKIVQFLTSLCDEDCAAIQWRECLPMSGFYFDEDQKELSKRFGNAFSSLLISIENLFFNIYHSLINNKNNFGSIVVTNFGPFQKFFNQKKSFLLLH